MAVPKQASLTETTDLELATKKALFWPFFCPFCAFFTFFCPQKSPIFLVRWRFGEKLR